MRNRKSKRDGMDLNRMMVIIGAFFLVLVCLSLPSIVLAENAAIEPPSSRQANAAEDHRKIMQSEAIACLESARKNFKVKEKRLDHLETCRSKYLSKNTKAKQETFVKDKN